MKYDTDWKEHYREQVWDNLLNHDDLSSPASAIMILDTSSAAETRHLVETRGYVPGMIHVCNSSSAHVACVQRAFPGVHTYGVDVATAARNIAKQQIRLSHANLDFCSNLCWSVLHQLRSIGRAGVFTENAETDGGVAEVSVTLLGGREPPRISRMLTEYGPDALAGIAGPYGNMDHSWGMCTQRDRYRIAIAILALGFQAVIKRAFKYQSGRQPMIVGTFSLSAEREPIPWGLSREKKSSLGDYFTGMYKTDLARFYARRRVIARIDQELMSAPSYA